MEKEEKMIEDNRKEFFTVPAEVVIDVFTILFDHKIRHRIVGVRERENCLCVEALFKKGQTNHDKALENITEILGSFGHFLNEGFNNDWS